MYNNVTHLLLESALNITCNALRVSCVCVYTWVCFSYVFLCVTCVCVYARVSALTFEFYFISREQLAYIAGRVTPSWKTVETRWKISQIRRPRGDSIDAHVSLTRSMPRATLSMTLSLFFSLFFLFLPPFRTGTMAFLCDEVEITTRRLTELNIWKGKRSKGWTVVYERWKFRVANGTCWGNWNDGQGNFARIYFRILVKI